MTLSFDTQLASDDELHAAARPTWATVDLGAISHNVALIRERAGRPIKLLMPVKANAYGHGAAVVGCHLESLGVDGLATANVDDAVAIRRAGAVLPILLYGAHLPAGTEYLVRHDLTPTVYSTDNLAAISGLATATGRAINVHLKVDAGMGRLGVRLDETVAFARHIAAAPGVHLEGIYTHIPFSDDVGAAWSQRRLAAFTEVVRAIEAERGTPVEFAQAAASSVISQDFDASGLNTIAPGHLTFGLHPMSGARAEIVGFRKALTSLQASLIQVSARRRGDDLPGTGREGLTTASTVGVILLGMDNGYRPSPTAPPAYMLVRGRRCPALSVSAEYTVINLDAVPDAAVGETVTIVGCDGDEELAVETVAQQMGAPSAAYWMLGLKNVPYRYLPAN